jgi:hypothetical protein
MTARRAIAAGALLACALAGVPAHAGSLTVRGDANDTWTVTDDPQPDANDFLLKHLVGGTAPDDRFGRNGQTPFTLGTANDPPASVRVDATHRTWMVGAGLAGDQPQPIVARFLADGSADVRWGVQGKVQLTPGGVAVKPNDLLPLADGSVLVAGEVSGVATPRAVVFHLNADGGLDRHFGTAGLWQRPGADDASTAVSLAASSDGLAAVAVTVRGARPAEELWSMTDVAPAVIQTQPLSPSSDGDDLRVDWAGDHWVLSNGGGGVTGIVPPALLTNRPRAPAVAAPASAADEGGFNPFTPVAASAPEAVPADDGLPWTWIVLAVGVIGAIAVALAWRSRKPATVLRKPPGY